MNRTVLLFTSCLVLIPTTDWKPIAIEARSSKTNTQSVRVARCFQATELIKSFTTLKLQGGPELIKVYGSLLSKARTAPGCRKELIQALVSSMAQATDPAGNQYENFYFWQSGASLLADLKATEALDLLIANIDFTDGWSGSLSKYHFPALAAILEIGLPAIPKLQIALRDDPVPHRRKFAALCIVYIGGSQAKRTLTRALSAETDPCTKKFLQLSVQGFDNRVKPNHISPAVRGKWGSALYCL